MITYAVNEASVDSIQLSLLMDMSYSQSEIKPFCHQWYPAILYIVYMRDFIQLMSYKVRVIFRAADWSSKHTVVIWGTWSIFRLCSGVV